MVASSVKCAIRDMTILSYPLRPTSTRVAGWTIPHTRSILIELQSLAVTLQVVEAVGHRPQILISNVGNESAVFSDAS
jgi:hypothetical protein